VLARNDKEVEGSIKKAIKKAQEHAMDQNLYYTRKPTVRKVEAALTNSEPTTRQKIGKWKKLPYTYITKAISEQLPTHDREAQ